MSLQPTDTVRPVRAETEARLHQRIQAHDWSRHAPGLAITLSAGLVMVVPGESFEQAIARADAMLYRAKRGGRNRVEA